MTDFTNKINILGQFYFDYMEDEGVRDFFEFNDVGLPLAYLNKEGLCTISDRGQMYVLDTWNMLLVELGVEDIGFETLDELLDHAGIED